MSGKDDDKAEGEVVETTESGADSDGTEAPEAPTLPARGDEPEDEPEDEVADEAEPEPAADDGTEGDDEVGPPLLTTNLPVFEEPAQDERWTKAPTWLREAYQALLFAYRLAATEADELRKIQALFPDYIEEAPTDASPSDIVEALFDEHSDALTALDQIHTLLSGGQVHLDDVEHPIVIGVGNMRDEYGRLVRMIEAAGVEAQQQPGGIPQGAMAQAGTIADNGGQPAAPAAPAAPPTPAVTLQVCPLCHGNPPGGACLACGGAGQVRVTA